jgi:thiol-disulfide isomerase/thioredoxin
LRIAARRPRLGRGGLQPGHGSPPRVGRSLVVWGCTAVIALLVAVAGGAGMAQPEDIKLGEFIPQNPPQPAPAISFADLHGKPATLADFKGRPVLVNLWATWCQPCLKEMPSLERLQADFGSSLTVAAISEDLGGSPVVEPFVKKLGIAKIAVYLDPKNTALQGLGARGLPTSILIDKQGRVVGRVEGAADWDSAKLRGALKPLLPAG